MTDPMPPSTALDDDEMGDKERAEARRTVLKTDLFFPALVAATGVVEAWPDLRATASTVAVVWLLTVTGLYAVEHDVVPGLFPEVTALLVLVLIVAATAGLIVVSPQSLRLVGAGALLGFGLAVVSYRTVFGLVLPVPEYRLRLAVE